MAVDVPVGERAHAILDFGFGGRHVSELRDVVVQAEIVTLAGRDQNVRAELADMWERFLAVVTTVLGDGVHGPGARARRGGA